MKKLVVFAAVAGLGLVSASPPGKGPDNGPREARRHYPPCSRTVTDRCIQLYERGVRARHDRAGDDHARDEHRRHRDDYAMADRRAPRGDDDHGDHRWCREHRAHHGDHHGRTMAEGRPAHRIAMATRVVRATRVVGCRCARPAHRQLAQRVRRAGERG